MKYLSISSVVYSAFISACVVFNAAAETTWQEVETTKSFSVRHEAGFVKFENKGYLIGGRGIKAVDKFDPNLLTWRPLQKSPIELHHFQPAVWKNKIVIAGALTGGYPTETPVQNIYYFYPNENIWEKGPAIPQARLRGSTVTIVKNDSLYLIGGITNGHLDGNVNWVDRYDFITNTWTILNDAPHSRDHAQGVLINNNIYVAGGRRTLGKQNKVFELVEGKLDIFNIETNQWQIATHELPIPRAGIATFAYQNNFIVVGGESANPNKAHEEVHLYNTESKLWSQAPALIQGRHGSGVIEMNGVLWIASGSGMQGGSPELHSVESIQLNKVFVLK
ncbi:Kelch repeat-containing protein [Shewanella livingstonensis]|uniref:Kelch-like protein n=1 Tax=Shewanella livingstonensis TaxID=150120 RepID=A0A3G8LVJ8_9GAMM|nr:kelch-like protein [Shewanella livingstonensis]AZG72790.1 kelch-like protein [Shewanella livingstonensis]